MFGSIKVQISHIFTISKISYDLYETWFLCSSWELELTDVLKVKDHGVKRLNSDKAYTGLNMLDVANSSQKY